MHLIWMWLIVVAVVFTVWACVNVLTGRVVRSHRLAHLAYVPPLWIGCLRSMTANPLLPLLLLVVAPPCLWIIYKDHLQGSSTRIICGLGRQRNSPGARSAGAILFHRWTGSAYALPISIAFIAMPLTAPTATLAS